jgi:ABC-type polysaccharide/polyol phosphate export permease
MLVPVFLNLIRPFNFDLFCTGKKFLIFNLVSRDLKIKYRRSFLGFLWTVLHPLVLCGIYYFIFHEILQVKIPNYVIFILSGVIPWTFFSTSVIEGTETLIGNAPLLTKVPILPQTFPFVACLTNFITFLLAMPIVFSFGLILGVSYSLQLLYLPILAVILFSMAYSLTLILSVAYVYLRDLKHALGLLMQIWFYATPILYKSEMIPQKFQGFLYINPLGGLFACFHRLFLGDNLVLREILISIAWAAIFYLLAIAVQVKKAKRALEYL